MSRSRTQLGLHESVGDSQVVSGDGLPVDHPQQGELGRQRVHDHRQVSLPHLSAGEKKQERLKGWTSRDPTSDHLFARRASQQQTSLAGRFPESTGSSQEKPHYACGQIGASNNEG